jgi:deazaflavin-dependent oxidoreductase (nitroreductase family)
MLAGDRRTTRIVPTAGQRRLHASALRLRRLVNLAPTLLLRSPLHPLMSGRFLLLTYRGRRTGRSYTVPAAYRRRGNELILTTDSSWWHNFTEPSPVTVRVAGRPRTGTAQAIRDPQQVADALKHLIRGQPSYARFAGIQRSKDGGLDAEELERATRERVLIRIHCPPRTNASA